MDDRIRDLTRRAAKAFERRDQMKSLYKDAQALGNPHRSGWDDPTLGSEVQRECYDSTYQDAVERLANALFVGMTPPWLTWIDLVPGGSVPEELTDDVRRQLQYPTKIVMQWLLRTGFYTAIHPVLMDSIFGTGAMEINEDDQTVLRYSAVPIHELGIEQGPRGFVDATFRRQKILARRVREHFPMARVPDGLQSIIGSSPDEPVELLSCVVPEGRGRRKYVQTVLWEQGTGTSASGGSNAAVMEEREFFELPIVVPRWSVLTGEHFGRGPALKASANAYTLNEAAKLLLIAANISIYGMWTVADDSVNPETVQLRPGAMIPVDRNDNSNPSIRPLNPGARIDVGQFIKDDLRSQIQRNLYRDNLGNVEGPRMTATEIVERQSLVLQDMGAAFGRLNSELLGPAITRTVAILARRGKLPPIEIDDEVVSLKYVSPLARAQSMEEVQAMRALADEAARLAQSDPSAAARVDSGKYLERMAALTGAPMDVLRDDEEVQQIMNQIAQAQATMTMDQGQMEAGT